MKNMNRPLRLAVLAAVVTVNATAGAALADPPFPKLVEGSGNSDCQVVLKGARIAFRSKLPRVYDGGLEVRSKYKPLIAWPVSTEELGLDETFLVQKRDLGDNAKMICVQKNAVDNFRFAIRQEPMNWQGDWFSIVAFRGEKTPAIVEKLTALSFDQKSLPANMSVVTSKTWQRPWLFHNPKNSHVVAVDTGHPAEILCDWVIWGADKNGKAAKIGKVAFRPAGQFPSMIPQGPLREMQVLTDQITGTPGNDKGTYHADDRAKLTAHHEWCNAIYRPWAMGAPKNSRATVDKFLKRWSKIKPAYARQYERLQSIYPSAKEQLTRHYMSYLSETEDKASARSAKSLDLALRSCFVLPGG